MLFDVTPLFTVASFADVPFYLCSWSLMAADVSPGFCNRAGCDWCFMTYGMAASSLTAVGS